MPGLEDLYREIILDHYRTPRNRGELPPPAAHAVGHNPLCGDEIDVYLQVEGDIVSDVKVGGQGCSISQSSASMMSQAIKGRPVAEVRALVRRFKGMMSIEDRAATTRKWPTPTSSWAISRRCRVSSSSLCASSARPSPGTRSSRHWPTPRRYDTDDGGRALCISEASVAV